MTTTDTRDLAMTQAVVADMDDIVAVLDSAAAWLDSQGIVQWPPRFEGERVERLREEVERGNTYLIRCGEVPVATATYTDWADPEFAHGWESDPDDAVYVVRLAAGRYARELTGMSVGALLLDHAMFIAGLRGKPAVRLDCSKTNDRLHAFYRRNLFRHVATVDLPHRKSGALFERRYQSIPGAASR